MVISRCRLSRRRVFLKNKFFKFSKVFLCVKKCSRWTYYYYVLFFKITHNSNLLLHHYYSLNRDDVTMPGVVSAQNPRGDDCPWVSTYSVDYLKRTTCGHMERQRCALPALPHGPLQISLRTGRGWAQAAEVMGRRLGAGNAEWGSLAVAARQQARLRSREGTSSRRHNR